jgi:hypothetical protein
MKWYESNPERLAVERCLLAKHHRGAKLIIKDGQMSVVKRIYTRRNTYVIEGIFADIHPYSPMQFYIREPRLATPTRHMYSGGQMCLHEPGSVGPQTTAKVYLDWAIQWIDLYERWLDGEDWPETNQD